MANEMGTGQCQYFVHFHQLEGGCLLLIHLNCVARVIGAESPAISLLFIPNTLDMNDIGSYVRLLILAWGETWETSETHKHYRHDSKNQKSNILLLVVLTLPHGLPRLHHRDLLLFQRYEVIQLCKAICELQKCKTRRLGQGSPTLPEISSADLRMSSISSMLLWISMSRGSTSGTVFPRAKCCNVFSKRSATSFCSVVIRCMISKSRFMLLICPCSSPSFPISRNGTMRSLRPLSTSVCASLEKILAHSQYCSAPKECLLACI